MTIFLSTTRPPAAGFSARSIRISIKRCIKASIAALILMSAGNAYAAIEVGLSIENDLDSNGNITVVNGSNVKVSYEVIEDSENDLNKKDKIQLRRLSDDGLVSSVNRGKKKSGTVSLKVQNSEGEQLYVRYVRKGGTEIARTSHSSDPGFIALLSIAKASLVDLTIGLDILQGPKTKSLIVHSAAFVPENSNVAYSRAAGGNGFLNLTDAGFGTSFLAPILLPAGVIITDIELYAYDTVGVGSVQASIWSVSGSTVTTSNSGDIGPTTVASGAINYTVLSDSSILIYLWATISHASPNLGLYSVKVNYIQTP